MSSLNEFALSNLASLEAGYLRRTVIDTAGRAHILR